MASAAVIYKGYSPEDKQALKELTAYIQQKTGVEVKLLDAIAAVEPSLQTPDYLKNC